MRTYLSLITEVKDSNGTEGHITLNDVSEVVKMAQIEALKELVKRHNDNFLSAFVLKTANMETVDKIARELIKEIENG